MKNQIDAEMQETYFYRAATLDNLEYLWDKNISENDNKVQWTKWKKQFIDDNKNKKALTFVALHNDIPIGEGTILFSPDCNAISGREILADNLTIANINALRIQKTYEGKGHISKLVKEMEKYASSNGFSYLTIGVEAVETRNLSIYLHWGYTEFVMSEFDNGKLVLYYRKSLR